MTIRERIIMWQVRRRVAKAYGLGWWPQLRCWWWRVRHGKTNEQLQIEAVNRMVARMTDQFKDLGDAAQKAADTITELEQHPCPYLDTPTADGCPWLMSGSCTEPQGACYRGLKGY